MKLEHQCSDRISALSQDLIGKILTLMPTRDALRTSVLSKKWRYSWASIPKLVFDEKVVTVYSDNEENDKYKLVNAIFHVLLLHRGPILEFVVCMADTTIFNEFDQIILHLSRSNNLKKFIFEIWSPSNRYKLPSLFFSFDGLEHLDLTDCAFEPPLTFNGFSILRKLRFYDVDITGDTLLRFLTNCPLIEEFTLIGDQKDFIRENKCTFVELFECIPSVKVLEMSQFYTEHFSAGGMPHKLPTSLVHLRILVLDVCFLDLSSALCVINSCPNLEKVTLEMCLDHRLCDRQTFNNLIDFQDDLGVNSDHLKEFEMKYCHISAHEMAFVKLIMSKSPLLKKARIQLSSSVSADEELQMFKDLLLLPFPRASPSAKFIIERG